MPRGSGGRSAPPRRGPCTAPGVPGAGSGEGPAGQEAGTSDGRSATGSAPAAGPEPAGVFLAAATGAVAGVLVIAMDDLAELFA